MECPNCRSAEHHHVIWGLRNLGACIANAFHAYFWLGFWPFISWKRATAVAYPLRRKCLNCGYKFLGEVPETPNFDECARCGYNLQGNVSGRCPECGWRMPRRYRAYRRMADRAGRRGSRRAFK